jgi:cellulose synthase (UDP-forming)
MFTIVGRNMQPWRAIAAALCTLLTFRYLWWHATLGMPKGQTLPQQVWAWIFFLFESMTNLSSVIVFFFLSRTKDRSADADAAQNSPLLEAPVDVFIVTYNEPVSVLERTIIGAKAITHSLRSSFSRVESPAWRRSSAGIIRRVACSNRPTSCLSQRKRVT